MPVVVALFKQKTELAKAAFNSSLEGIVVFAAVSDATRTAPVATTTLATTATAATATSAPIFTTQIATTTPPLTRKVSIKSVSHRGINSPRNDQDAAASDTEFSETSEERFTAASLTSTSSLAMETVPVASMAASPGDYSVQLITRGIVRARLAITVLDYDACGVCGGSATGDCTPTPGGDGDVVDDVSALSLYGKYAIVGGFALLVIAALLYVGIKKHLQRRVRLGFQIPPHPPL